MNNSNSTVRNVKKKVPHKTTSKYNGNEDCRKLFIISINENIRHTNLLFYYTENISAWLLVSQKEKQQQQSTQAESIPSYCMSAM